jgi:RimJ/RimL family protein N-acetyltransferase
MISAFTRLSAKEVINVIEVGSLTLRRLELKDVECLYRFRNDWEITQFLGGFSVGYSRADLESWIKNHSSRPDEILWAIAEHETDECVGHAGLYKIDHRAQKAEFAIVLGNAQWGGKGYGTKVTSAIVDWAFLQLNLRKISLAVLNSNRRALHIYEKLGFQREGVLHDEQIRDGEYLDLILMALFKDQWRPMRAAK